LTELGRDQADSLGRNWADTRIDHLLSSPYQRAHDTAKALSSHNKGHPEIVINHGLVERRYGRKVHRLMPRDSQAGSLALEGTLYGPISRYHCPAEGGESMNMVAWRAESIIRMILKTYAVNLSQAPEFFVEKKATDTPAVLPDGIPHVVIVSHNIFFMELYEKLNSWGKEHLETNCHWNNANW
jgi:broad specificity phosphatase PhoE